MKKKFENIGKLSLGEVLSKNEQKNVLGGDYTGGGGGGGGGTTTRIGCQYYKDGYQQYGCVTVSYCPDDSGRRTICSGYFRVSSSAVTGTWCIC